MVVRTSEKRRSIARGIAALLSILLLGAGNLALAAQEAAAEEAAPKFSNDQLDSLVAPIALYPDPLLSQALVASTYPLEIIQAQQWMAKNPSLKGDALEKAALEQDWDPSIQAMVALPDMVKRLTEDITWTTNLGNAFLAQQGDVMEAVQRLRLKAKDAGKLESSEQQKVETKVVETKTVVVIEPASFQGNMIGGFALVAWPAQYRVTGVQTFLVGHDGIVYQQDLGRDTAKVASATRLYDPGKGWTVTEDEADPDDD